MKNLKAEKVTVYCITERGLLPSKMGIAFICKIVGTEWPEYVGADAEIHAGIRYNDPALLIKLIESDPNPSLVLLTLPKRMVPLNSWLNGKAAILSVLREGIEQNPSAASWEILSEVVRQIEDLED